MLLAQNIGAAPARRARQRMTMPGVGSTGGIGSALATSTVGLQNSPGAAAA
jgi:hypothetical protein